MVNNNCRTFSMVSGRKSDIFTIEFFEYLNYKGDVTLFYLILGYFLVIITSNYSRLKIYLSNNKIR